MSTSVFSWPKGWAFHPYNLCIRRSGFKSLPTNNHWIRISSRIHSTWDLHIIDFTKCPQDMLWRGVTMLNWIHEVWQPHWDLGKQCSQQLQYKSCSCFRPGEMKSQVGCWKGCSMNIPMWIPKLEPWRCCCWQCYRLPAVEGEKRRFWVKPFMKLSHETFFELANFKFFQKSKKLKDQRNCELWAPSFFLPNGTMSRFKRHTGLCYRCPRPQQVAPQGF